MELLSCDFLGKIMNCWPSGFKLLNKRLLVISIGRWVLSDQELTPSQGGRFGFVVPSSLWVMTGDWELWFPGPVTGSSAFWPLSYTHPVLSETLKFFSSSFASFYHILTTWQHCVNIFSSFITSLLGTCNWVCGNDVLTLTSNLSKKTIPVCMCFIIFLESTLPLKLHRLAVGFYPHDDF